MTLSKSNLIHSYINDREPKSGARTPALFSIIAAVLLSAPVPGLTAQGDNVARRLERSADLIRLNKIAEAERELAGILKVAPNDADALNLLGTIRAQQGRLKEAESLFRQALRANGSLISAHMNLAYLYALQRAPENTISEFREVLRLDPANVEASYKLARLLLSEGRVDDSIQFIEDAMRSQKQGNTFLLVLLGDAYLKKGNPDKAEESYLRALS